jgi:hypothetical protein
VSGPWLVLASTPLPPMDPLDPTDAGDGDVGTAGPLGLLIIIVLLIMIALLVRSMSRHLKRVPKSFDREPVIVVPDDAAELFEEPRRPGEDLLDTLRKAPRAIEGPRPDDDRPDSPRG